MRASPKVFWAPASTPGSLALVFPLYEAKGQKGRVTGLCKRDLERVWVQEGSFRPDDMEWRGGCSGETPALAPQGPEILGTSRVGLAAGTWTFTPGSARGPWGGVGGGPFLQGLSEITGGFLEVLE